MPPKSFISYILRYAGTKSSRFADGTPGTAFPTNQSKQRHKLKLESYICVNFLPAAASSRKVEQGSMGQRDAMVCTLRR